MTTERKVKMVSTKEEILSDNHGTGVEFFYCCVSGEPDIRRVNMNSLRKVLGHSQTQPEPMCIFVGKGAQRAARKLMLKEERLGVDTTPVMAE